ncbi:hypothetical protein D0C16_06690 [Cellvibrio sp. KY-GH-1]|uniref:hypothetical protein n=1 Tax=Cellvibrio sp. KY-GH-1 TaxID=2303332 RepID=UPI001243F641|nr:hypothetical protein [Cellvibrio sp. KY-GH-1]QEY15685.1 hypothetical protein D0C16_06690 [Cellvibrio sp. KY-GH-1]
MSTPSAELLEAVFLYQDEQISRELLYPEFEAILDGFIPFPDFANTTAKAVYLQIDSTLCVTGLVFFLISFDASGMVDRRWNVPLRQLIDATGTGPDMGAGAIRLACYSQCPIAWHQKNLWDPLMDTANNSFVAIRKAVKSNRLGMVVKPAKREKAKATPTVKPVIDNSREQEALEQKLHDHYTQELRDKMAMLIKEQRLRIATLMNQHQAKVHSVQIEQQERVSAYQQKLHEYERECHDLNERNRMLKENLDAQVNKIEGMREYFAHKLKAAQAGESGQIQLLQENFALEMEAKISAATGELREMLDMREVELFYRHQNEMALKEEIVNLKREQQQLLKNSGDQLLERLTKAGVSLVTFLPGLGEMAIPLDDIGVYLEDTQTYAAEKAGVSEAIYLSWLEHHQSPCCNAVDPRGHSCGRSITVIETPFEFHPGESDRCSQHQTLIYSKVAERR